MKKICILATVPFSINVFMKPHIAMLARHYDVTLIANGTEQDVISMLGEHVKFIHVGIARKISLWLDLVALIQLYRIFRKERFDVVHTITPKAGLLGMLAAFLTRVTHRVHTFTGQVWANKIGIARWGLKAIDNLIVIFATRLLADSFSQRQFLITQHVVKKDKIVVLGNGSACGVDIKRFKPNLAMRHQVRSSLGIPDNAIVYLFLGRLNKDKGVLDLAHAFSELAGNLTDIHLLVVGPDEGGMDKALELILFKSKFFFHRIGYTNNPEDYMASADVFCLPSYREGFGSVIIEAAAVGVPAIASNVYGLADTVKNGETGILHHPKNIQEIKLALLTLANNDVLRLNMSKQAMVRAHELFDMNMVVAEMAKFYQKL